MTKGKNYFLTCRHFLEFIGLKALAGIMNFLPMSLSAWIAREIGKLMYFVLPGRRKVTMDNLTIAYGESLTLKEKERLAQEAFQNLAMSLMEFFRIPVLLKDAQDRFRFEGMQYLDEAFAKGKGVIFVLSHLGSWEYLSFLSFLRDYPFSAVVTGTKNPYIYQWIQELRRAVRINPLYKKNSIRKVLHELKQNRLVAILIDQWAGKDGLWVDFFSKPTSTTSIPARLALKTGAALVPGYCLRIRPGYYKIVISPEVQREEGPEAEEMTTLKLNRLLEKEILNHPEQWSWTHCRWKGLERYQVLKTGKASESRNMEEQGRHE